jgi:hypothetical protein
VRDYTPEYESFRDDAVALIGGAAVAISVMSFWKSPAFMGPIALAVAIVAYLLSPRSKGGTILAVLLVTLLAMLVTYLRDGTLA